MLNQKTFSYLKSTKQAMVSLFKSPVHILGTNTCMYTRQCGKSCSLKKEFSPSIITLYGSTYVHYDSSVNEDL